MRARTPMIAALAICAVVATDANAQASAPPAPAGQRPSEKQPEDIIVTGSRISGVRSSGSNVNILSEADIADAGRTNVNDILQQLPQVFNLGINETSRTGTGGSGNRSYATAINLRGLSPFATLTLVDGHRAVPNGTLQIVDASAIPTIGLSRIDISADGGSAIYGSDAIVGVANLILRRNLEGIEVRAQYGRADDYNERLIGLAAGHSWSTGQFTFAAESSFHSALAGASRDFNRSDLSVFGGTDFSVTQCDPGNIVIGGVSYAIPASGATPDNLVAGTLNRCDNIREADILPRIHRMSGMFTFNQNVTDWLEISASGYAFERTITRGFAAPAQNLTVLNTNAFFVAPAGLNPVSETVQYSFARDYGGNFSANGLSRAKNGTLQANVRLSDAWKLHVSGTVGDNYDVFDATARLNSTVLRNALASNDPSTAFNPFGTGVNDPALLRALNDGISRTSARTFHAVGEAQIEGRLFSLPAGPVRVAGGIEHQFNRMDPETLSGRMSTPTVLTRHQTREVTSAYAEFYVPLFGADNAIPGIYELNADLALRRDHYDDVGNTTNPKIGVDWKPFRDLRIRGTYGTSFRAPSLSQLATVQGNQLYLQNYSDPLANGGAGGLTQGVTLSGGNEALMPEEATTYSVGFDYTPSFAPQLSLSATYFHIDYKGQIDSNLANLNVFQQPDIYSAIAFRRPTDPTGSAAFTQQLQNLLDQGLILNGGMPADVLAADFYVDGRYYNLGETKASGIDFSASYSIETGSSGKLSTGIDGTYFLKFKQAVTPTAPMATVVGTINYPVRFRARGRLGWANDSFDATAYVNHLSGYENNLVQPSQQIDPYTTFDLHLAYKFGGSEILDRLSLSLDAKNLLDREPPFVNVAPSTVSPGGFDPNLASPIGRLIAVSLNMKLF